MDAHTGHQGPKFIKSVRASVAWLTVHGQAIPCRRTVVPGFLPVHGNIQEI